MTVERTEVRQKYSPQLRGFDKIAANLEPEELRKLRQSLEDITGAEYSLRISQLKLALEAGVFDDA